MRKIYLIDCPGIVPPSNKESETDIVLKGVVRIENISHPDMHIEALLSKVKREYLVKTYGIMSWENVEDFLDQVARKAGKLLKGGEPDHQTVSKMILNDWLRGKIPYFTAPPMSTTAASFVKASNSESTGAETEIAAAGDKPEGEEEQVQEVEIEEETTTRHAVPVVKQLFSKIPVAQSYLPEDLALNVELRKEEKEMMAKEAAAAAAAAASGAKESKKRKRGQVEEEEEEEEVDWDDVFENVEGEEVSALEGEEEEEDDDEEDDDEDVDFETLLKEGESASDVEEEEEEEIIEEEEESAPKKKQRMTTNKKKVGTHYYETANVKNKNRNKKAPISKDQLEKKLKNIGKTRKGGKR